MTSLVLVHGAGHTAEVWERTRRAMRSPSVAVDLPGRRQQPGSITTLTLADASTSAAATVRSMVRNDDTLVLAGHSTGAILLPQLAGALTTDDGYRIAHLVFVAGLSAPDGAQVVDTVLPNRRDDIEPRLSAWRATNPNCRLDDVDDTLALTIESLNLMTQTVRWPSSLADVPRTFVRSLRDPIQSRTLQARLAENCGATEIVDIDTGHTPALDDPRGLAALLDSVADRHR